MQLLWGLTYSLLSCRVAIAAVNDAVGHVYLSKSTVAAGSASDSGLVDPETARLIFAQRLGVSRFHKINHANSQSLRQINAYGGTQKLFAHVDRPQPSSVFIVFEGVEKPQDLAPSSHYHDFLLSNPPSIEDNAQLLLDFAAQADVVGDSGPQGKAAESALRLLHPILDLDRGNIVKSDSHAILAHIRLPSDNSGTAYRDMTRLIRESLNAIFREENRDCSVTVAFLPPSVHRNYKRSVNPYGMYEVPRTVSQGARRGTSQENRSPQADASRPAADDGPLRGILPACYSSRSQCESTTRNCSGHGQCFRKHGGKNEEDSDVADCWACGCQAEVVDQRTTYWAGPACQKKDISTPFWLFAGFTIVLVSLVSGAVGLLYSMGNEELPSVIGAGVSGPKAK